MPFCPVDGLLQHKHLIGQVEKILIHRFTHYIWDRTHWNLLDVLDRNIQNYSAFLFALFCTIFITINHPLPYLCPPVLLLFKFKFYLQGCCNSFNHVWRHYVSQCEATHIAIKAHSAGGGVVSEIMKNFPDEFKRRVFANAFTGVNVSSYSRSLISYAKKASKQGVIS